MYIMSNFMYILGVACLKRQPQLEIQVNRIVLRIVHQAYTVQNGVGRLGDVNIIVTPV